MKHADKVRAVEEFLDWREAAGETLNIRNDLMDWSARLVTGHAIELLEEGLARLQADLARGADDPTAPSEDPIKDAIELLRGVE